MSTTYRDSIQILRFFRGLLLVVSAGAAGVAAMAQDAYQSIEWGGPVDWQLNLQPAATKLMAEMSWLHWMMLIICSIIFVAVFGVMFYSIFKFRKSKGHKAQEVAEPLWVEIAWTVVPFIIVIGMALPATKVLVAGKDTSNADLTVKVTGYQWKWGYDYLRGEGEGIGFLSTLDPTQRQISNEGGPKTEIQDYLLKVDNPLVVPVGKKIRIITTAQDVIHSWTVPRFGVKQDAIPGFVRDTWFKAEEMGTFYGQCVELCGKEHAYMPIQVKVVSPEDYTAWVAVEKKKMAAKLEDPNKVWALGDAIDYGSKVYANNCAACHQANGKGAGPIKALDGSALVVGPLQPLLAVVVHGVPNKGMPAWNTLSDTQLATVTTYIRNSWSNNTGTVVQPAEAGAAR